MHVSTGFMYEDVALLSEVISFFSYHCFYEAFIFQVFISSWLLERSVAFISQVLRDMVWLLVAFCSNGNR